MGWSTFRVHADWQQGRVTVPRKVVLRLQPSLCGTVFFCWSLGIKPRWSVCHACPAPLWTRVAHPPPLAGGKGAGRRLPRHPKGRSKSVRPALEDHPLLNSQAGFRSHGCLLENNLGQADKTVWPHQKAQCCLHLLGRLGSTGVCTPPQSTFITLEAPVVFCVVLCCNLQ